MHEGGLSLSLEQGRGGETPAFCENEEGTSAMRMGVGVGEMRTWDLTFPSTTFCD